MLESTNSCGYKIFIRMIELARDDGGFLEYSWEKPDKEGTFKKVGYMKPIPGTDFLIGSGVYFPKPW